MHELAGSFRAQCFGKIEQSFRRSFRIREFFIGPGFDVILGEICKSRTRVNGNKSGGTAAPLKFQGHGFDPHIERSFAHAVGVPASKLIVPNAADLGRENHKDRGARVRACPAKKGFDRLRDPDGAHCVDLKGFRQRSWCDFAETFLWPFTLTIQNARRVDHEIELFGFRLDKRANRPNLFEVGESAGEREKRGVLAFQESQFFRIPRDAKDLGFGPAGDGLRNEFAANSACCPTDKDRFWPHYIFLVVAHNNRSIDRQNDTIWTQLEIFQREADSASSQGFLPPSQTFTSKSESL